MSIYGELDFMLEYLTQLVFKSKRKHIAKVNIKKFFYPNQHIDNEIPNCSRDNVIVPGTIKFTFNRDVESTDKTNSIVNYSDINNKYKAI